MSDTKVCVNCNEENPADEPFCSNCGEELDAAPADTEAVDQPQPADEPVAEPPSSQPAAASEPAVATISHGGQDIPLAKRSKVLIAREGTDKCQPDLAINSDQVSSTPIEVTVDEEGKITVTDSGTSIGIRVVKYLEPGASIEVKPGEMIMLGNNLVTVT